jgi:hypothetical protein
MPLAGFEPTVPASDRPHTVALDRAALESRLALNHLFKDSNSVFMAFYHLQETFAYIFHD